jgi:hypothetical protein
VTDLTVLLTLAVAAVALAGLVRLCDVVRG